MKKKCFWVLFMFLARMVLDASVTSAATENSKLKPTSMAKDTNHDGKPDRFTLLLKGRNLILREVDTNFDGKIDQRSLMEWDPDKKITIMTSRIERIPNPGYAVIWREEDKDFNGKIDAYREKGKKDPEPSRIGQSMNPNPTTKITEFLPKGGS